MATFLALSWFLNALVKKVQEYEKVNKIVPSVPSFLLGTFEN
jgi:hypothetical protein